MVDEFRGLPPKTVPTQPLAKLIANQAPKCLAPKMLVPGTLFFGARHFVFALFWVKSGQTWCQALC